MARLDPERIFSTRFPVVETACDPKDAILYALCCGAKWQQPGFVHENGLKILPSFGQNLCYDDYWMDDAGVDLASLVHGGLDLRMTRPLQPGVPLALKRSIAGLVDKGEGRAGMVLVKSELVDKGEAIFTSLSNLFVLDGGGFGGSQGEGFDMVPKMEGEPDVVREVTTHADWPLYFRLLGDRNPLHVVPEVAQKAGFKAPIMHGANTFGAVCHDLLQVFCNGDPARMKRFTARFSGPVYPGETLRIAYRRRNDRVEFSARVVERDTPALDGGLGVIGDGI